MSCISLQGQTTPEKTLSNPWHGKGFCEAHQYKSAIDRCEGGYHSLDLGIDIYKRLVKVTQNNSAAIREWSTSSQKQINESKEFGTNKLAWLNSIRAVEKLAERNDNIGEGIQKKVVEQMIIFKTNNYGKSFIHVRQIKEFETEFKKVQRAWLHCLDKINDAREAYHDAKRKLRNAEGAENVIKTDVGSSDDQQKKAAASVERRTTETQTSKEKYQKLVDEMQSKRGKYESDMFAILKRTDDFERKRLEHFKLMFTSLQEATLIENDKYHSSVLEAFTKAIKEHDADADIAYFNKNYGCETKTKWPVFKEIKE